MTDTFGYFIHIHKMISFNQTGHEATNLYIFTFIVCKWILNAERILVTIVFEWIFSEIR